MIVTKPLLSDISPRGHTSLHVAWAKTTSDGQLACTFCACVRENTSLLIHKRLSWCYDYVWHHSCKYSHFYQEFLLKSCTEAEVKNKEIQHEGKSWVLQWLANRAFHSVLSKPHDDSTCSISQKPANKGWLVPFVWDKQLQKLTEGPNIGGVSGPEWPLNLKEYSTGVQPYCQDSKFKFAVCRGTNRT